MKKSVYYILILAMVTGSCMDLEENPIGKVAPEGYFQSEKDVQGFVQGLYANLTQDRSLFTCDLYSDLLSDEYDVSADNYRPYRFLLNQYEHGPADFLQEDSDGGYWVASYAQINQANIIIVNVSEMISLVEEKRLAYVAEARFVRALIYFHMIRRHGDIPFYTEPLADPRDAKVVTRTSAEEIYQYIIGDLKICLEDLPDQNAFTTSQGVSMRTRPTRGSALALLAKIHLTLATYNEIYADAYDYRTIDQGIINSLAEGFSSHWDAAAWYALEVINNRSSFGYELEDDFQNLFNGEKGDSKEFIFSVDFSGNVQGGGVAGQTYDGWRNNNDNVAAYRKPIEVGGWGAMGSTMHLFEMFHWGDYRRDVSFDITLYMWEEAPVYNENTGEAEGTILDSYHYSQIEPYPYPYSAKWTRFLGEVGEWPTGHLSSYNIPDMRYAEVLLIAAEALNEMGQSAEAIGYLNELRARARKRSMNPDDDSNYPVDLSVSMNQEEAYEAIWNEWSLELCFEWERWFNLIRRDSLVAVISRHVPFVTQRPVTNIQPYHKFLPIPQFEFEVTEGLIQNKGY
jgi:hypothetical protein